MSVFAVTLCFILSALCISRAQYASTAVNTTVAEVTHSFSVDLLKVVFGAKDGNLVISPVSVSTLLALIQQGSGGNTEAQLTQVLHLDPQQSKQGYSRLTKNLKESSGSVSLEFANAAFLPEGLKVSAQFENTVKQDFQSTIQTADFNNRPATADVINSWVARKTHNKIRNLVSSDTLSNPPSFCALVNVIYFKGLWKIPFEKEETRNDDFFVQPNSPKLVPTMHLRAELQTGSLDGLNSRWLRLPFEGNRFYLLIILPNAKDGVHGLVDKITGPDIFFLIKNMEDSGSSPEVVLSLPKFQLETVLEFRRFLQQMGVRDIFASEANLSGISEQPLHVSQVVQKALLEVDEEGAIDVIPGAVFVGASAAAASGPATVYFTVDHPFLVLLVDGFVKLPLFTSRVSDPSTS